MHAQIIERIVDEARFEVGSLTHEPAGGYYLIDDKLRLIGRQLHPFSISEFVHDEF